MTHTSQETSELIHACCDPQNTAAWQEFVREFHRLIAGVVIRTAARWGNRSPEVIDELIQETYLKLCADGCRLLREFQERRQDSIYGYIKVVTANLVNDYFRAQITDKRGGGAPTEAIHEIQCAAAPDHDGSPAAMERAVLMSEIMACMNRCTEGLTSERDRLIFRFYFIEGYSFKAIAAMPEIGLTIKGVESAIQRIKTLIRERLDT
jgi:RNA polymerase sigma-70 factor (ECF subfamily)